MAERIVSMHAAHRSGKEVVGGFLSRLTGGGERPAIVLVHYKKKYEIEMYNGAGHAFLNNPSSKNAANLDAAAKSVARTATWLKKVLT